MTTTKWEWVLLCLLLPVVLFVFSRHDRAASIHRVAASKESTESTPSRFPKRTIAQAPPIPARSLSVGLPEAGHWRGKPALADLNHDGRLDLVASIRRWNRSTPGEGLWVWLNDGHAGWTASIGGLRRDLGYGGTEVADIDHDGNLDIAFSGHDVTPSVFLGDGKGSFAAAPCDLGLTSMCSDVALGDLDGDGHQDLAALGFWPGEGGLWVYRGDGRGSFSRIAELLGPDHYGAQIQIVDLDGDQTPEIIAATDQGPRIWRRLGAGDFEAWPVPLEQGDIFGANLAVAAADLDGDGIKELLAGGMLFEGHSPLRLWRFDGANWSDWGSGLPDDEPFFDVVFAKLQESGPPRIVAAGKAGISVIDVTREGVFRRRGRIPGTEGAVHLGAGDVTGDGRDEIVSVGFNGVHVLALDSLECLEGDV